MRAWLRRRACLVMRDEERLQARGAPDRELVAGPHRLVVGQEWQQRGRILLVVEQRRVDADDLERVAAQAEVRRVLRGARDGGRRRHHQPQTERA